MFLKRMLIGMLSISMTLSSAFAQNAEPKQKKPNIVYFLVDNTGWGSFGVYGGTVPTPNIDKLASQGIRFNNYNVEAQCTPSRSAIMTGRHPVRSGTTGYATALYGKWHLGNTQGRMPNDQGFDEWWGTPDTWDQAGYTQWPLFKESGVPVPMLWEGKKGQKSKPVMPLDLKIRPVIDEKYIIPKTVEYIKKNAAENKPFFVYVGYSEMHEPPIANPNFAGKSPQRGGLFADLVAEMDYRVGQVMQAVKDAGVEDNTIFIFSSDNAGGGASPQIGGATNGPFRGNFFNTPFEGSMRVPAMIRWPGHVPSGMVTEEMFAAVDWMPTIAGMVGSSNLVPKDRPIDGVDASNFMLGKSKTTGRDLYPFFGIDGELMSIKWKIYKTIFRYAESPESIGKPYVKPQIPMIYDLSSDPHEDNNLMYTDLTLGWVYAPSFKWIEGYEQSVKKYPNIKVGEDFKGYANK